MTTKSDNETRKSPLDPTKKKSKNKPGAEDPKPGENKVNQKCKKKAKGCRCCCCCKKGKSEGDVERFKICFCECCFFIIFSNPYRQPPRRRVCCKWKFCQPACLLIWLVMILALIFGLLFCVGCYEFTKVALDRRDWRTWIYTAVYIWFVFVSSLFFLIVTKMQCGSCCCLIWKCIWLTFLHIPFGLIVSYFIYTTANPTPVEVSTAFDLETEQNEPHDWLVYLQKENFCCFMYADGSQHFGSSQNYTARCKAKVENRTMGYNEHTMRCDELLARIYDGCMNWAAAFVIVLLVLGVIPFVVYTLVYVKARNLVQISPQGPDNDASECEDEMDNKKSDDKNKIIPDPKSKTDDEIKDENQNKMAKDDKGLNLENGTNE